MKIPLCRADIGKEEINAVTEVLKSGWLTHGPKNKEFEKKFAEYIGVKHAITLNSCTSALQLAIQNQDITGEVILPSFTFVASANAIVNAGAKPVFVDIDYDTCNIDPEKIKEKITDKTQAIMLVHYGGQTCDMDSIMKIAKEHNLKIIEDSAENIGGEFGGKKAGSFETGCFSFFPTKNLTTGEGGMLTTNDDELAEKVRAYIGHGILSSTFKRQREEEPWFRAASFPGYNFRMSNILAAIGSVQMDKLDNMNDLRRKHASYLNKGLADVEEIDLPLESKNCKHVYQMYTIKLSKKINRTQFIKSLREKGIEASVHFNPPVHLQPAYEKYSHDDLKVTEDVAKRIVTLPMFPSLTKEQLDYIIETVKSLIK